MPTDAAEIWTRIQARAAPRGHRHAPTSSGSSPLRARRASRATSLLGRGARRGPQLGRRPLRRRPRRGGRGGPRPARARRARRRRRHAARPRGRARAARRPPGARAAARRRSATSSTRSSPSSSSSSATATASPTPPRSPSPSCPPRPTTRCSSTARPASARPTCCTRSATTCARYGGGATVRCTTAEAFTNEFLGALHGGDVDRFKARFRDVDVLLIDDVQFLESKARTEEEFFHTFNALHDAGSQVVLTSDRLPRDLAALEDRLRERFESGLVADIAPPDLATRMTVLRKRVHHDGVAARRRRARSRSSPTRIDSNIRALEGALIRVVAFHSLTGRPHRRRARRGGPRPASTPVRPSAPGRAAPSPPSSASRPPPASSSASRATSSSPTSRAARVAWPRQVAMYLARELTGAEPARHRPGLRRAQPHHRPARLPARRRARRRRSRGLRDGSDVDRTDPCRPPRLTDSARLGCPVLCITFPQRSGRFARQCTDQQPLLLFHLCRGSHIVKLETSSQELLAQLQTVTRVASTRSAVQALSGVQLARRGRRSSCAPPTWRSACASRSQATIVREGTVVLPARLLLDVVRQLPGGHRVARAAAGRAGRRGRLRARRSSTCARCAPRTSRTCPSPAATRSSTCRRRRSSRRSPRSPARPRATRRARSSPASSSRPRARELRMVATDSYRLSVKETALEPPIEGGFEANVPARALQELERIVAAGGRRADPDRRARQPGRLRGRRRRAVLAADRGPVPQLPPAAARDLRARAAHGGRGARRRRAPHQPDGAEERAAAAELRARAS